MVIGITGLIGSGKSTAASILRDLGAAVIDADLIGRQVVDRNPGLLKKLARQFGREILTKTGRLNRKKLAASAFENEQARTKLNRLVHPYLLRDLNAQLKSLTRKHDLVVIDAALLLEWKLDRIVDLVIMVHASEKDRLGRLVKRGINIADARARQARQLGYAQQRRRADHVVLNNGSAAAMKRKLEAILKRYHIKTG